MAFNLGSVIAKIDADISGFNKGIKEAQKGMTGFKGKVESGLKIVRNSALVATGAITAIGAASFKLAKDAGKYESIRGAFVGMTEGMGFSVEEFETKVADASRNTISNLDILSGANKALALIGKDAFGDFGDDFAKMAELSKKAARATGQDVNFMFDSLVTGISRESKLILDNLGVTVDITQAKKDYAESLGKGVKQLTETEAKTAVLNAVMGKLDKQYENVEVSGGGFSGALATLQTTLANAKNEIGLALIPVLNDLVRAITPIVQEWVPKIVEWISEAVKWFMNLSPPMQKIILAMIALAPVIAAVTGVILILMPVIAALLSPIGLVALAIIGLAVIFIANFAKIKAQVLAMRDLIKLRFDQYVELIKQAGKNIKEAIMRPFREAWDYVQGIMNKIKDALDFTKRQSPSVVDIVNRSVREVNNAMSGLQLTPPSMNTPLAGVGIGTGATRIANVTVSMEGAIVGDLSEAGELGEKIGDSIIKRLQSNVRF